ncbi:hypothetical protein BDA96_03G089700 [Sorghum bicolor]|jgi:hypothetical protein|uniref:Uncharacterized protein n=2 Tax=Sorghum bicolor TaxID=4558 RepID=C5XQV5_SORBI|nr:uncharacterized protein LOC8063059 [Sorghum bicolor]EES02553.1 hypothetical protein SORBI_3003G085700 [Sorghum bicolor]KAG0536740.1 hypothetical protein BDA96_03G089700 [Sorghum bicolor]OQU86404.1 hypothetical protein SORBI_3003G085700 [Sorghum bicolor]OQU86405.1 hypothetical protein SORBI_3003G085700 [Sorghum bicolor]OQU86406.1 hypothetical protein SORBI_3003G085700 [Sorghum bicolor]|eukprot:XP_002457433.1 uncharacterized protein LOC8063059 [Sorghum bicolor]
MESSSHKRAREVVDLTAAGPGEAAALPEADAKRLRPQDLLDMLDDDTDAAAAGDLASVMRSLEEEIASFDEAVGAAEAAPTQQQQQPELGFLLEASDDELGLPPAGASASSSEEAGGGGGGLAGAPPESAELDGGQIWGFEDEIDGGAGFGGYSPEAAAAAVAAAAAWDDDGFDAGLFAFGESDAYGPSDLAALRHETMPAV